MPETGAGRIGPYGRNPIAGGVALAVDTLGPMVLGLLARAE
ncbi:MAG: hypothetical protein WBC03_13290 [Albidovulum sp.]|nr:hypothetical protein [uncultured Defluviimonas sp.]